jgi:hypothetical protein
MANVNGSIASAPIATVSGSAEGYIANKILNMGSSGVGALVGTLTPWIMATVAAGSIATFGGTAAGHTYDARLALSVGGTSSLTGTLTQWSRGSIA